MLVTVAPYLQDIQYLLHVVGKSITGWEVIPIKRFNFTIEMIGSGQPNTVSVRFWPKFSAKICFSFGLSAFFSFGDSAETCFFGRKKLFRPK